MKLRSIICIAAAVVCFTGVANAELHPTTIGVRFTGGVSTYGYGGEFSYQKALGAAARLELGLSYVASRWYNNCHTNVVSVFGAYQWHFDISGIDGFHWYVGPGAAAGLYTCNHGNHDPQFNVGAGGQIGIEYDLKTTQNVPLVLSFDVRPLFNFLDGDGFWWGSAFAVRYTF